MSFIRTSFECPICKKPIQLDKILKPSAITPTYVKRRCPHCESKIEMRLHRHDKGRQTRFEFLEVIKSRKALNAEATP